jgi:hypothetical protein
MLYESYKAWSFWLEDDGSLLLPEGEGESRELRKNLDMLGVGIYDFVFEI